MLEWQRDLLGEPEGLFGEAGPGYGGGRGEAVLPQSSQVQVLIVPTGKIEQVQRGTTAGDIIRQKVLTRHPSLLSAASQQCISCDTQQS